MVSSIKNSYENVYLDVKYIEFHLRYYEIQQLSPHKRRLLNFNEDCGTQIRLDINHPWRRQGEQKPRQDFCFQFFLLNLLTYPRTQTQIDN